MYVFRTHVLRVVLGSIGVAAVGCPGSLEDPDRFQVGLGDAAATCPPGFDVDKQIFQKTCASSICHDADQPEAQLDLSSPSKWSSLIGKPSSDPNCATKLLINPQNPEQSYFFEKVALKKPACGDQMPNIPQKLTAEEIDCVRKWTLQQVGGGSGGAGGSGGLGGSGASGGSSGSGGSGGSGGDSGTG